MAERIPQAICSMVPQNNIYILKQLWKFMSFHFYDSIIV